MLYAVLRLTILWLFCTRLVTMQRVFYPTWHLMDPQLGQWNLLDGKMCCREWWQLLIAGTLKQKEILITGNSVPILFQQECARQCLLPNSLLCFCRSFEPILYLSKVYHTPECQHWAIWALANLTRVYRKYRNVTLMQVFWLLKCQGFFAVLCSCCLLEWM